MKKLIVFIAKALLSIALIIFALYNVDFIELGNNLRAIDPSVLLILFIIIIIQKVLISEGFKNLFHFTNVKFLNTLDIIKVNFKSSIYFLAFPGFAAPDIYLTAYYSERGNSLKKILATLILNRFSGLVIFLTITVITLILMYSKIKSILSIDYSDLDKILYGLIFLIVIIGIIYFLQNWLSKKIRSYDSTLEIIKTRWLTGKQHFLKYLGIKIFWYFFSILSRVLLASVVGIEIKFFELLSIIIIVNTLVALPISISGFGVRETGFVTLLGIFGISTEKALMLSFLDFGIVLGSVLIGALILFSERVYKAYSREI